MSEKIKKEENGNEFGKHPEIEEDVNFCKIWVLKWSKKWWNLIEMGVEKMGQNLRQNGGNFLKKRGYFAGKKRENILRTLGEIFWEKVGEFFGKNEKNFAEKMGNFAEKTGNFAEKTGNGENLNNAKKFTRIP
jgi:hypothetical protein